jgi:hypothetical protein
MTVEVAGLETLDSIIDWILRSLMVERQTEQHLQILRNVQDCSSNPSSSLT